MYELAARILALAALLFGAEPTLSTRDEQILGDDPEGLRLEQLRFQFTTFDQAGHGYQSRAAGRPGLPGSESLLVLQPMLLVVVGHGAFKHTVAAPVDIVSSASADALDAISTASRHNEVGSIDVTSSYAADEDTTLSLRYGGHMEENFRAVFGGFGLDYSFAEDNAAVSASFLYDFDEFDPITPFGRDPGNAHRITLGANISFSQVLSPTTIGAVSYGATYQQGTLEQTWNAVPIEGVSLPAAELFPRERWRHAFSGSLAQHIPFTRSTLKGSYRYYLDSFEMSAHTVEAFFYQYVGPDLYLRGSWRYHTQDGAAFYSSALPHGFDKQAPRTADSDLAPLSSQELGLKVVILVEPFVSFFQGSESVDVSYFRYFRDNDLGVNVVSVSYGGRF